MKNNLTAEDKDQLMAIAKTFHQESCYNDELFDEDKFKALLNVCLVSPDRMSVFYHKVDGIIVGGILGYIAERYFSKETTAGDLGMFILPEYRGSRVFLRLLKEFEEWAISRKVSKIIIGHTTKINMEKAPNFYKKLGYDLQGFIFCKENIYV